MESPEFDYFHFASFLAYRNVRIIPFEDLQELPAGGNDGLAPRMAGRGSGMEVTWMKLGDELVAVKRLTEKLPGFSQQHSQSDYCNLMRSVVFEIQVMSHKPLCDHPNITKLMGVTFNDLLPLPVVESALPEYPDLAKYIDARNRPHPLPLLELYSLISDIADGLSSLHDFGVVHGDIKPENILVFRTVNGDGITAKIADFGSIGIGITRDVPDAWTPLWVPPDYNPMCEESACPSVDIYSFGRVALYLCSEGALPEYPTAVERDIVLQCIAKLRNDDLSVLLDLLDTTLNLTSSERCKDISKTRQVLLGPQYQSPKLGRDTIIPFNKSISRTELESEILDMSSFDEEVLAVYFENLPSKVQDIALDHLERDCRSKQISQIVKSNLLSKSRGEVFARRSTSSKVRNRIPSRPDQLIFYDGLLRGFWDLLKYGSVPEQIEMYMFRLFEDVQVQLAEFGQIIAESDGAWTPACMRRLLQKRTRDGYTCFHFAASGEFPGLLKRLHYLCRSMPKGAKITDRARNGWTPLHQVIYNKFVEGIEIIIDLGADCNAIASLPFGDVTPIMIAIAINDRAVLGKLLSFSPDVWIRDDRNYRLTAAHMAAVSDPSVLRTLLQFDPAQANARDTRGKTPLHMAGWECEDERIKGTLGVLLEYGADPNAQDVMGRTPLYYAWQSRTFLALSTEQPDLTAMSERACNRDVLLKDGADASIRDRLGFTASQIACQFCETFNGRAAWGTGLYGWEGASTSRPSAWLLRRIKDPEGRNSIPMFFFERYFKVSLDNENVSRDLIHRRTLGSPLKTLVEAKVEEIMPKPAILYTIRLAERIGNTMDKVDIQIKLEVFGDGDHIENLILDWIKLEHAGSHRIPTPSCVSPAAGLFLEGSEIPIAHLIPGELPPIARVIEREGRTGKLLVTRFRNFWPRDGNPWEDEMSTFNWAKKLASWIFGVTAGFIMFGCDTWLTTRKRWILPWCIKCILEWAMYKVEGQWLDPAEVLRTEMHTRGVLLALAAVQMVSPICAFLFGFIYVLGLYLQLPRHRFIIYSERFLMCIALKNVSWYGFWNSFMECTARNMTLFLFELIELVFLLTKRYFLPYLSSYLEAQFKD